MYGLGSFHFGSFLVLVSRRLLSNQDHVAIARLLPIADFDWYITNEPFRERYDESARWDYEVKWYKIEQ